MIRNHEDGGFEDPERKDGVLERGFARRDRRGSTSRHSEQTLTSWWFSYSFVTLACSTSDEASYETSGMEQAAPLRTCLVHR